MDESPDAIAFARRCVEALLAEDNASRGLDMELLDSGPGFARVAMLVRENMTNGHGRATAALSSRWLIALSVMPAIPTASARSLNTAQ